MDSLGIDCGHHLPGPGTGDDRDREAQFSSLARRRTKIGGAYSLFQIADVDTVVIRWVNADLVTHVLPRAGAEG